MIMVYKDFSKRWIVVCKDRKVSLCLVKELFS